MTIARITGQQTSGISWFWTGSFLSTPVARRLPDRSIVEPKWL
jgi:hypothetical protein